MFRLSTCCCLIWVFCFGVSVVLSFDGQAIQSPLANPEDEFLQRPKKLISRNDMIYHPKLTGRPAFRNKRNERWPNNIVPYEMDGFSKAQEEQIQEAINDFYNFTCIKWIPKRPEDKAFVTFTRIVGSRVCGQTLAGYKGELGHVIKIECVVKTTLVHEMLHLLGFVHEQDRKDRNQNFDMFYHNMPSA